MFAVLVFALLAAQQADIARLEEDVRREPLSAAAWKRLGIALAARQKLDAALPALEKACTLDSREEDACYYLGRTLHALDRWQEAREPFDKALRAAGKSRIARVHRAVALNFAALGSTADAERHFRQAVLLNPGPAQLPEDPRVDYGAFLFRQGRPEEALPFLSAAVQAAPRSSRAHAEYGKILLHVGKVESAATHLQTAVNLDPRAWPVRLLLGRAWLQLGRTEEGQRELRIARQGWTSNQGSSNVR